MGLLLKRGRSSFHPLPEASKTPFRSPETGRASLFFFEEYRRTSSRKNLAQEAFFLVGAN